MTAEAKVILTAQDRTAAAFRSAKANLDQFNRGLGGVQSLLAKFGVGFSVAAITTGFVRAAKSAIEYGDELQKAAAKTGIAASDFGVLAEAAKMADVDMQSLSTALKKMQVALSEAASGAKAPKETLAALGLTIQDLQRLKPEDQFLLLADRISQLQEPADRVRASVELFGKAGADLLPFFEQGASGIRALIKEVERLGGKLTEEQINKFVEADDALKGLSAQWGIFSRELTVQAQPAIVGTTNKLRELIDLLRQNPESLGLGNYLKSILPGGLGAGSLAGGAISSASGRAMRRMFPGYGYKGSAGNVSRLPSGPSPESQLAEEQALLRQVFGTGSAPGYTPETPAPKTTKTKTADPFLELRRQYENIYKEGTKALQSLETPSEAIVRNFEEQKYALEQLAATYPSFAGQAQEAIARLAVDTDDQLQAMKQMPPVMQEAEEAASQLSIFAEEAARNMQSAFADFFYSFDGGLKGMLSSFVDTIRKMAAQLLAQQILTSFFSWGSSTFGGSTLGKVFGAFGKAVTGKATGGPVMAGVPYKVGERGAEMFVPASNGMIIPNHAMGGGMAVHYNIDARGATQDVIKLLPAILEETSRRTVERTKAAVRDDIRRFGRVR